MNDEPFGAPVGKFSEAKSNELKNEFANIQPRNVEDMLQSTRIQPRQMGTGTMRGTQRIVNTDGSYITLGVIPDTAPEEFGIAFFDADDNLVAKSTGPTDYKYLTDTGNNYYQSGTLPDGSRGTIYVKPEFNVADAFDE